jgi:hypothetical protein
MEVSPLSSSVSLIGLGDGFYFSTDSTPTHPRQQFLKIWYKNSMFSSMAIGSWGRARASVYVNDRRILTRLFGALNF